MKSRSTRVVVAVCGLFIFAERAAATDPTPLFGGNNSYAALGTPDALQIPSNAPFTVEGWMRFNALSTRDMLYCKNNARTSPYTYMFGFADHKLAVFNTAWQGNYPVTRELDRWYHVASSFDGTNVSIYLDGVLLGASAFSFVNNTAHTVKIGGYAAAADINGSLSDVRVWNYARSEAQIQGTMSNRLTGTESGLLGYWPLNEGGGTVVHDFTAHRSNGDLLGASWRDPGGLALAPATESFRIVAPFFMTNRVTGSAWFTYTNAVVAEPQWIPEGYTNVQITASDDPAAIVPGAWEAIAGDVSVVFPMPAADTNVTLYAWFTNTSEEVALCRARGEIRFTSALPVLSARTAYARGRVLDAAVILQPAEIDAGSTGGETGGESIPIHAMWLNRVSGPSGDATPQEPSLSLSATGVYEVELVVQNGAGTIATSAVCTVEIVAYGGNPLVWTGTAGANWSTAGNWSPARVPAAADDVFFDITGNKPATVDTPFTVASLTVGYGYTGVITQNADLLVTNAFSIQSGVWRYTAGNPAALFVDGDMEVGSVIQCQRVSLAGEGTGRVFTVGGTLTVSSNGVFDAYGHGFLPVGSAYDTYYPDSGPGQGIRNNRNDPGFGSGAGHGGQGGNSRQNAKPGGLPYGSITNPISLGSGGGWGHYGAVAYGGGAVSLAVGGDFHHDGTITCNAKDHSQYGGGGAGGSANIRCGTFSGGGAVTANGEPGSSSHGGGGSGGRLAVYCTNLTYSGVLEAYGASGAYAGAAGTVYFKVDDAPQGTLVIDNNGRVATQMTLINTNVRDTVVGTLVVRNGGKFNILPGQTFTVLGDVTNNATVTITGGTFILDGPGTSVLGGSTATTTFHDLLCTTAGKRIEFQSGRTFVVGNVMTAVGASDALIALVATDVDAWKLVLPPLVHELRYLDVADSDASGGVAAAAFNSIDSGDNLNWSFAAEDETDIWIGAVSSDWQDPDNWNLGRPPVATDTLVITNDCPFYPVMDIDKFFAGLVIHAGASMSLGGYNLTINGATAIHGTLKAIGTETVACAGTVDLTGGTILEAQSVLVLVGTTNQLVRMDGEGVYALRLANTGGIVFFDGAVLASNLVNAGGSAVFSNSVTAGALEQNGGALVFQAPLTVGSVDAYAGDMTFAAGVTVGRFTSWQGGPTLTFHAGTLFAAERLALYGTATAPLRLRSATPGIAWRLQAARCDYVNYVDAQDSDASPGEPIRAIASVNSGNNAHWQFLPAGVSRVWTGATSTDFTNSANWAPAGVPDAGSTVILDGFPGTMPQISAPLTVSNLFVGGSEPVILTVDAPLTVVDRLAVLEKGTLTHSGNTDEPATWRLRLEVTNELAVFGVIDVTGRGYKAAIYTTDGCGPGGGHRGGTGDPYYGSGGGYGGGGGDSSSGAALALGGLCYGSITQPVDPGSGGGWGHYNQIGHGGGVIDIGAGTIHCEGLIRADGVTTLGSAWAGAGSGGSVRLLCGTLSGSGEITADGGDVTTYVGGGGGGRIALTCADNGYDGVLSAFGGRGTGRRGAAGTVYLTDPLHPLGTLIIDNDNLDSTAWTVISALSSNDVVGDVVIRNGGRFMIDDDCTLTVTGSWTNAGTFVSATNGVVHFAAGAAATISGDNTFGVLSADRGKTLRFAAGSTTTVRRTLRLRNGVMQSTESGMPWYLILVQPVGEKDLNSVQVRDSDASGGVTVDAYSSTDLGNNLNWNIMAARGTVLLLQ